MTDINLGISGLSGSGKTTLIYSMIKNFQAGNLPRLRLDAKETPWIRYKGYKNVADLSLAGFDMAAHDRRMANDQFPEPTRMPTKTRLDLERSSTPAMRMLGANWKTYYLYFYDFPGEWMNDLALIGQSFGGWSEEELKRIDDYEHRAVHATELNALRTSRSGEYLSEAPADKATVEKLAGSYVDYIRSCHAAGLSILTPGRFAHDSDMAGILPFAPMRAPFGDKPRGGGKRIYDVMEERYNDYRRDYVEPFYRDVFAKLHSQIILIDPLKALAHGEAAFEELRLGMSRILDPFTAKRTLLERLIGRKPPMERVLFAATKADTLSSPQRPDFGNLVSTLVSDVQARLKENAERPLIPVLGEVKPIIGSTQLAAARATKTRNESGRFTLDGDVLENGKRTTRSFDPLGLPEDAAQTLVARAWPEGFAYEDDGLAKLLLPPRPEDDGSVPNIDLDAALSWLISPRLGMDPAKLP